MKITDLLISEAFVSYADPDREPGAYELEGKARASLAERQKVAIVALNELAEKYTLGVEFSIGKYSHIAGEFIKVTTTKKGSQLKDTDIKISRVEVDPRDGHLRIWLDCPLPNKNEIDRLNANAKIDLDLYLEKFIGKSRFTNDAPTMLSFGAASTNFSNSSRVESADILLGSLVKILKK